MKSRIVWTRVGAGAVAFAAAAVMVASSGSGSAQPGDTGSSSAEPIVNLNDYCGDHGAVGQLNDGRTVYCTQVSQTDAWVWSYRSDLMPRDPNTRNYTCTDACRYPDGSFVPGYLRCGVLCGEPPTSGDVQSGFYDCFSAGGTYEECIARTR